MSFNSNFAFIREIRIQRNATFDKIRRKIKTVVNFSWCEITMHYYRLYRILFYKFYCFEIDDIIFNLFAMHCGIGWGIRKRLCRNKHNELIVSLGEPPPTRMFFFFLNAISFILSFFYFYKKIQEIRLTVF